MGARICLLPLMEVGSIRWSSRKAHSDSPHQRQSGPCCSYRPYCRTFPELVEGWEREKAGENKNTDTGGGGNPGQRSRSEERDRTELGFHSFHIVMHHDSREFG